MVRKVKPRIQTKSVFITNKTDKDGDDINLFNALQVKPFLWN